MNNLIAHRSEHLRRPKNGADLIPASPPPPLKLPSRKWRDLIRQAWHVDPLQCPVCQKQMRSIAFIDNPDVVEKILRHMKLWVRPKAGRPEALGFSSSLFA